MGGGKSTGSPALAASPPVPHCFHIFRVRPPYLHIFYTFFAAVRHIFHTFFFYNENGIFVAAIMPEQERKYPPMHHIKIMLSRLWQCADRTRDRLLFPGCDFAAWVTQEAAGFTPEQGNQYQPSTNALPQVLRRFPITSGDRILDVGCGKGKAMALMRRFPFGQVAGFDISPALADVANRNFRQLKLRDCHAFQADAATFTGYDDYNYLYFYNSLPKPVFREAIGHLEESLARRPRCCRLIYLNPVYHDFLVGDTAFREIFRRRSWSSWFTYVCYEYRPG